MIWPFRKKKKTPGLFDARPGADSPVVPVIPPPECQHKWRDFPWILQFEYDEAMGLLEMWVTEPYVCIKCKKRKDVELQHYRRTGLKMEEIEQIMEEYQEKYREQARPCALVEDMIADFQNVDREWLEIADKLWPERRILG